MTKEIEIKEAIEILNNDTIRIQILSDFADKEYCGQALQTFIDLAQQYLKVEMPKRFEHIDKILQLYKGLNNYSRDYQCGFMEGHNSALHDFRLWQMKKLEKMEEVIEEVSNKTYNIVMGEDFKALAQAIHNLFNKETQ